MPAPPGIVWAWLIEPRPDGCRVLTEETQYGWARRLGGLFMPSRMHRWHQVWLEKLSEKAAGTVNTGEAGGEKTAPADVWI